MNDYALKLLSVFADKLGTTSELLWSAVLRQATISGCENILWMALLVKAAWWWWKLVERKTMPVERKDGGFPEADWEGDGAGMAWASVWFSAVLVCVAIIKLGTEAVSAFLNPEYWALHHILW